MQAPRALRQLVSRQVLGNRAYHAEHQVSSTLNDLPTPQGSWKTHNDAKQRSNNAQLLIGIGSVTGTLLFGKVVGFLEFHDDIPQRPLDIPSYRD